MQIVVTDLDVVKATWDVVFDEIVFDAALPDCAKIASIHGALATSAIGREFNGLAIAPW